MITIAAVDSSVADKAAADVVCDGVNDQADINTALGGGNIEVFLFNGNYQIDAPIDLPPGAVLRGNAEAGVVLLWRPFLLGPVFKAQGLDTSPFALNPFKGRYMWRDMEREAARFGLPFRLRWRGFARPDDSDED